MTPDEPLFERSTPAERREQTAACLLMHPSYSDRRIARIAAVSRELVRAVRRDLVASGKLRAEPVIRAGADGKTYTRLPRPRSQP